MVAVERGEYVPAIDGESVPLIGPNFDDCSINIDLRSQIMHLFTLPSKSVVENVKKHTGTEERSESTSTSNDEDDDRCGDDNCEYCKRNVKCVKKQATKQCHRFSRDRYNWLLSWCTGGTTDDRLIRGRILFLLKNFTDHTYFRPFDTIESSKIHLVKQISKGTGKIAVVRLSTSKPGDITIGHLCLKSTAVSNAYMIGNTLFTPNTSSNISKECGVISLRDDTNTSNINSMRVLHPLSNPSIEDFNIIHQRFSVCSNGNIEMKCSDGSNIELNNIEAFVRKYYQVFLRRSILPSSSSLPSLETTLRGLLDLPQQSFQSIPVCGYEDF